MVWIHRVSSLSDNAYLDRYKIPLFGSKDIGKSFVHVNEKQVMEYGKHLSACI